VHISERDATITTTGTCAGELATKATWTPLPTVAGSPFKGLLIQNSGAYFPHATAAKTITAAQGQEQGLSTMITLFHDDFEADCRQDSIVKRLAGVHVIGSQRNVTDSHRERIISNAGRPASAPCRSYQ